MIVICRNSELAPKSVKFWTLITIDSENCDPRRLTPRQQLAYIARRAQSGGQLLSDFNKTDPLETNNRVMSEYGGMLNSTQDLINQDLLEIAASDDNNLPEDDIDKLIELAAEFAGEQSRVTDKKEDNEFSYLPSELCQYFQSVSCIQKTKLELLERDRSRRLAHCSR